MPALTAPIQHSTGRPGHAVRQEEEMKGTEVGKEEVKFSLFADDTTVYIKNPKNSTKKEISKVAGYKINIQKLVAFFTSII